jgi:hypothetical protein
MAEPEAGEARELFERITSGFMSDPTVSQGTGFGSSPGLRVGGRIFAMLAGGALVVKLPKDRVDQLVASGVGARFDPGHGRVMREWVTVPMGHATDLGKAHRGRLRLRRPAVLTGTGQHERVAARLTPALCRQTRRRGTQTAMAYDADAREDLDRRCSCSLAGSRVQLTSRRGHRFVTCEWHHR